MFISSGWWFGTWILFSISCMGCHPSHWGTHIFQRGRYTTNHIYILIISNIRIVLLGSMFRRDVLWFDSLENWGLEVSNVVYRSMFWTKTWNHINHHVQKVNDIPPKKCVLGISLKISQRLGKLNPPIAEGILKSPANLLSFQRWSWVLWIELSLRHLETNGWGFQTRTSRLAIFRLRKRFFCGRIRGCVGQLATSI